MQETQETWVRAQQPTSVFLPGEFHGQRTLVGYSPQCHTESDPTEAMQHAPIESKDHKIFQVGGAMDSIASVFCASIIHNRRLRLLLLSNSSQVYKSWKILYQMLFFQEKLTSNLENGMAVFLLSNLFFVFMQRHFELCNQPSFSF